MNFNPMMALGGGLGAGAIGQPPGGPAAMLGGGALPAGLMTQIQPGASPDAAMGGAGGDPRIQAIIRALMGGGMGIPGR